MMVQLKHEHITAKLASDIHAGRIRRGERLPGEAALAHRFAVSRNTVRSALAELADAGLISKHSGKGSFVMFDARGSDAQQGWAQASATRRVEARSRVVSIDVRRDDALAAEVGLRSPEIIVVELIRELPAGPVISFECSAVPCTAALRPLPQRGLPDGSLSAVLRRAGLTAHHGRQRVTARPLTADEARVLHRQLGEWFLDSRRTTFDRRGRFVEDMHSLLDPRHFELELQFTEDG